MSMTETKQATTVATITGPDVAVLRTILAHVGKVASTDLTRGAICGVQISFQNGQIHIQATDTYRMIDVNWTLADHDSVSLAEPFVVNAKELARATKTIGKRCQSVTIKYDPAAATFTIQTVEGSAHVPTHSGSFPDLSTILFQTTETGWPTDESAACAVDGSLLAGLLDSMVGILGADRVELVNVGAKDGEWNRRPWLWRGVVGHDGQRDGVVVRGIIMPLRK